MIQFLNKLAAGGILLELSGEKLKLFTENKQVDPSLMAEIKAKKEDIISYLKSHESLNTGEQEAIPLVPEEADYAVSFGQHRLWTLSQQAASSQAYHMPMRLNLDASSDLYLLRMAIDQVIDRHEILRTVFVETEEGMVRQKVLARSELNFRVQEVDLSEALIPEAAIDRYMAEDHAVIFDLRTGPLFRITLFTWPGDGPVLYLNMHHIISDGWSMSVLMREIMEMYAALSEKRVPRLPAIKMQYKDYTSWQRTQFEGSESSVHRDYWKELLSNSLTVLDLPSALTRPRLKTYNGESLQLFMSAEDTNSLKQFGQGHEGSLFISLLAVWNILLSRYTRQADIVMGSVTSGRDHSDLEEQLGFYVNTLVFRNQVNSEDSFRTCYNQTKDLTRKAYTHQAYPFDLLVEELNLQPDLSRNPLFDIMLVLQEGHEVLQESTVKHVANEVKVIGPVPSKFDLTISCVETRGGLLIDVNYNTDVYERVMVSRLMRHFVSLQRNLIAAADEPIGKVPFLADQAEQERLLNYRGSDLIQSTDTILDRFERQLHANADHTAIQSGGSTWTYQTLDAAANQLHHFLVSKYAVQEGDLVGLLLPRSDWTIISMLAILKAGCGYVPIDMRYPQSRIEYIEQESEARLMINENVLEDFRKTQAQYSTETKAVTLHSETVAHVIYTSGSTGRPKGVVIPHRGVVRLSDLDQVPMDNTSRVLHMSSLAFDLTTFEVWSTLLNGGTVVVYEGQYVDYTEVNQLICAEAIDTMWITSALFDQWVHTDLSALPLKYLLSGGDVVKPSSVLRAFDMLPAVRIFNGYGPTENSTFTTMYEAPRSLSSKSALPVGLPIPGTHVYILDQEGGLCPEGVVGELCTSGIGLSQGYFKSESLTKEKFIPNRYQTGQYDQVLYKTGDLAYWREDGNIEFIGRSDFQVKIRGNRIDLGEVSEVLTNYPGIKTCEVMAVEHQGEKNLAAYYDVSSSVAKEEVKTYLGQQLPGFMVPSYFVEVDRMPVTSNGKVDRKQLPEIRAEDLIQQAYIKYLQERANGKGKTTTTAERAKNKKLIAEAERAELELAIKKGEYVEVGEVKEAWVTMVSRFKSKMLALPTKLAASCYGKSKPQIQAEAKAGIREALEELADDESD